MIASSVVYQFGHRRNVLISRIAFFYMLKKLARAKGVVSEGGPSHLSPLVLSSLKSAFG